MNLLRPRLTAADIVARAVPRHLREEYRRFGYVTDLTVSALTERAARQWPDRPALAQADRRLAYPELRRRAGRGGWGGGWPAPAPGPVTWCAGRPPTGGKRTCSAWRSGTSTR